CASPSRTPRRWRASSSPPRRWWPRSPRRRRLRCPATTTAAWAAWISKKKTLRQEHSKGRGLPRPFFLFTASERHETCAGAALDGGGDQALDRQPIAQQLEETQLLLRGLAVARHDVAGERIGGLAQARRQRGLDVFQSAIEAVLLLQQVRAGRERLGKLIVVEAAEDRQMRHDVADGVQLRVGDAMAGRRSQNHRVDQSRMMIEQVPPLLTVLSRARSPGNARACRP